jgi:hypothetical protein
MKAKKAVMEFRFLSVVVAVKETKMMANKVNRMTARVMPKEDMMEKTKIKAKTAILQLKFRRAEKTKTAILTCHKSFQMP